IDSVLHSYGLPDGSINQVGKINSKYYYFLYENGDGFLFDGKASVVRRIPRVNINSLAFNETNNQLYIVNRLGEVELMQLSDFQLVRRFASPISGLNSRDLNYRIFLDTKGDLWLYAKNFPLGTFRYDIVNEKIEHFCRNSKRYKLNNDNVSN